MTRACRLLDRLALLLIAGGLSAPVAALQPGSISEAQSAQHDWITTNNGRDDQQRDLEAQLAYVDQNVNFAMIDQLEGVRNRAELEQRGSGNLGLIAQGFGDDNTARLTQDGDDNHAVITQAGQRNIVTVLNQTGSSNYVKLVQQGDDNRATVDQQGNGNRLDLRQRDAFNVADISQHGGTDLTIVQSNPDGNVAAVNSLTLRSFTEPGSDPLIRSMSFDGPQARELFLCNGSAAYCESVR